MYKFQLFKQIPPIEFVKSIISQYGPDGFDVNYYFNINDIIKNNVVEYLNNKVDELKTYYLPCKYYYITNITPKKSITILRQLLRPYNYKLFSLEKYSNGNKYLLYNLIADNYKINHQTLIIKFD